MRILDRYLGRGFLSCWLSVNLVLAGLLSFLELARQLDDIGKGRYSVADALLYVGLTLPGRMLEMAPPSALLGSILALGLLVKNHELAALQAGGVSIQRVGWAYMKPAILTLLLMLAGAQFVIPSLEQTAWTRRETALARSATILPRGGFWTRDERRFINLRSALEDSKQGADIYQFDENGSLTSYTHANQTRIGADGRWELRDVQQKSITEQGSSVRQIPRLVLSDLLTREQADVLVLPPQTLSLSELRDVMKNLEERGQNAGRYRLALWQKLALPLMSAAMIMISLPFVGRQTRGASFGWQIMVGAIIGVLFYYLNQILGYAGLMLQISPVLTTLLPALAVLAGGLYLTRRIA